MMLVDLRRGASRLGAAAVFAVLLAGLVPLGCSSAPSTSGDAASDAGHDAPSGDAGPPGSSDSGAPDSGDSGPLPEGDAGGPIAASMNDVSILFPLPSSTADIGNLLGASSSGARGVLLPEQLYSNPAVGPISGSTRTGDGGAGQPPIVGPASVDQIAAYSDLRVVAMRIDPCFASLAPDPHGAGCAAQLRLVFQEVRPLDDDAGVSTFDSALHAFYSLTRAEFLDLARALVALRVANQAGPGAAPLGPLAPHPIIAAQGLSGAMAKGVFALVLRYAGAQNLTRAAQLSTQPNAFESFWSFSAVDVIDATAATTSPFVIPSLSAGDAGSGFPVDDAGDVVEQQTSASNFPFTTTFQPRTTSADDLAPLDTGTPTNLGAAARQAAFDALVRVENPRDHSAATIDCASCHFAAPTEAFVARPTFSLDDTTGPLAFEPDGTFVTPADMAATYGTTPGVPSIHAFSYFGPAPTISQRVVNETAAVVDYLNTLPE